MMSRYDRSNLQGSLQMDFPFLLGASPGNLLDADGGCVIQNFIVRDPVSPRDDELEATDAEHFQSLDLPAGHRPGIASIEEH